MCRVSVSTFINISPDQHGEFTSPHTVASSCCVTCSSCTSLQAKMNGITRQNRLLETRMGRLQSELRKAQCDLQHENKGVLTCD